VTDTSEVPFHCEVENSVEEGVKVTTVRCHGRLINQTAGEVKAGAAETDEPDQIVRVLSQALAPTRTLRWS
jgi:hypothetical protein